MPTNMLVLEFTR